MRKISGAQVYCIVSKIQDGAEKLFHSITQQHHLLYSNMASPAPSGIWVPHFTPEGRPFWNHSGTKESVWSKPTELKTPVEREMEKTPWEEYETGGRKYWVHAQVSLVLSWM